MTSLILKNFFEKIKKNENGEWINQGSDLCEILFPLMIKKSRK
jgi:predicted helicase